MAAENNEQPENLTMKELERQSMERLLKNFESLLHNPTHSDFIIVCGQQGQSKREFPVHKAILAARSHVFDTIIDECEKAATATNKLVFNDIDPQVMHALLLYIYSAKVPQIEKFAPELLTLAERFGLSTLKKLAQNETLIVYSFTRMRSLLARNLNQLPGKTRVFGLSSLVLQPGRAFAAAVPSASEISIEASNEVQTKKNDPPKESASFCMNLFLGKAALDQVFPYPLNLDDERREMLQMVLAPTAKFLEEVNDPFKNDETASIPREVLAQFGELGAFGAVVPEQYGGAGLNNTQMARLAEIVGANDLGLGVTMGAHQSIGYKGILLYGTPEQKAKYLPDLATGKKFAAFCLTEPSSGSDANSIRTRAERSKCGKFFVLNGGKIWISNGGFADVFTVFAQTPIKQPDGSVKEKVSAFIVERSYGGITSGPPEKKMGIKGSNTTEVHFDNVKVPVENLVGQEGEGFKVAMNILNNGRFGIPAATTGAMKYCIQKTVDHVNQRVQFGKKIKEFGRVQEILTDMVVRHYVAESITYSLASNMDRGVLEYQLEAAIGKVVSSENAWQVCDDAIQLHGGMGFMRECGLERVLRDLRIFRIFEGANDILRLFVALTGMQYAGKHLQQIAKDIKAYKLGTLVGEVKRRTFGESMNKSHIIGLVHPSLKNDASTLNTSINKFGRTVEKLLKMHRKGIVDRQYELIRVANAAIDIYSTAIVLSRCNYALQKTGGNAPQDQLIANLFCRQALKRINANLDEAMQPSEREMSLINKIAAEVCANGGMVQKHPIDL